MKKIRAIIFLPVFYLGCLCTPAITESERMEGFKGNIMRIYIKIPYDENFSEEDTVSKIQDTLLAAGNKRAILIMESHLRTASKIPENDQKAFDLIKGILATGKIFFKSCNSEGCEAFLDYDIQELNKFQETKQK